MTNEELDKKMLEITKNEVKFLEENEAVKNEHGAYVFISQDKCQHIALDLFLYEYKQWLIENKIVKEI